VTDGRDQGTVVFTDAQVINFIWTLILKSGYSRRFKELNEAGRKVDLDQLRMDIKERDHKDFSRSVGPLKKALDAVTIDSTGLDVEGVVNKIMKLIEL
jgi:cytidylate kinase